MPDKTAIGKFVESLRTGRTGTTKALLKRFQNPGGQTPHPLTTDPDFPKLQQRGSLASPTPQGLPPRWWQQHLPTLKPKELDHIDAWPNDQKEEVRGKLVEAAENNRRIDFFWDLHSGRDEAIDIEDPDENGSITVTFRSPRRKVRVRGLALGDITVDM